MSDGIILTGFSLDGTWVGTALAAFDLQLANLNQPARFGNASSGLTSQPNMKNLPDGYLTWADIGANEFVSPGQKFVLSVRTALTKGISLLKKDFFAPGDFDLSALEYSEAHKMPATMGEFLTLGGVPASAPDFKGPVLIITGSKPVLLPLPLPSLSLSKHKHFFDSRFVFELIDWLTPLSL